MSGHLPVIVTLVRHGAVEGPSNVFRGTDDPPLSAVGLDQITAREPALTDPRPTRLLTSPRQRCTAFAHAVATRCDVACEVNAGLAEADFGAWEGLDVATVGARDPDRLATVQADPWHHGAPGSETLTQVADRAEAALRPVLDASAGGAVLVVTHAGVLRAIAGRWLGLDRGPVRIALGSAAWLRFSWLTGHAPWLLHHDAGES